MKVPFLARLVRSWRVGVLAGRALNAAVYGDLTGAQEATARIIRRGTIATRLAAAMWCEAILLDVPRARRAGARPVFLDADGRIVDECDIDVAAEYLWATRLVAAHANQDAPMFTALVAAVPAARLAGHLAELLAAAADAVAMRSEGAP